LVVTAIAVVALTQPVVTHFPTIEALTVPSTCVFTGYIQKLDSKITVPRGGYRGNTIMPDGYTLHTLAVHVQEVLKGKPGKQATLEIESTATDERWQQWAGARTQFLWFTGPGEFEAWSELKYKTIPHGPAEVDQRWIAVRLSDPVPAEETYRGHLVLPLFAMDRSILRTRDAVLANARTYIAARHKTSLLKLIPVSGELVRDAGLRFGGPCYLIVPGE
jgi:hypothetical protein